MDVHAKFLPDLSAPTSALSRLSDPGAWVLCNVTKNDRENDGTYGATLYPDCCVFSQNAFKIASPTCWLFSG